MLMLIERVQAGRAERDEDALGSAERVFTEGVG
jgi:hypothetical protein